MDREAHWQGVYGTKGETEVSWYQREPLVSLELIEAADAGRRGRIVDIGGGASLLVDRLLELGFAEVAVLDISEAALAKSRARLGERAGSVEWIVADVARVEEIGTFDLWHDRAVFHFLTDPADRRCYVDLARRTIPTGGHLLIATFAEGGPTKCSGLDVCRYDASGLGAELGEGFELIREARESHATPWGSAQAFFYGLYRRTSV